MKQLLSLILFGVFGVALTLISGPASTAPPVHPAPPANHNTVGNNNYVGKDGEIHLIFV